MTDQIHKGSDVYHTQLTLAAIISLTAVCPGYAADPPKPARPKYGPKATRLFKSREYIQQNAAPDFWALMPYYMPQQNDRSCSVASLAMIVNAARADRDLTASEELATHDSLLAKVNSRTWNDGVGPGGEGLTLDELGVAANTGLKVFDVTRFEVAVVHVDEALPGVKQSFHQALLENEKSDRDFMVINFLQSTLTDDPEGAVGHIAVVGAYDARQQRVLVLDPDRRWYEPYWVPEATLLAGLSTQDPISRKPRGYLWVKLAK